MSLYTYDDRKRKYVPKDTKNNPCSEIPLPNSSGTCTLPPPEPEPMTLTPEQENLRKVWLAQKELHFLHVGSYNEWAAEVALRDALQCCLDAGFDPRNPCSETPLPDFPLPGPNGMPTLTPLDPKPMQKYNRTIRCVYITPADDTVSPLFSEKAVIVTVEDEAGGPFILINTASGDSCHGEVRLDPEELDEVVAVARELIYQPTLKESGND
jgi:hypothetical protein